MSESKHTPGPWKVSPTDDTVVIDATGAEVAAIDGDYNDPDTWPQMEANARLIAAAPDLLSEAKKQVEWLRMLRDQLPQWDIDGFEVDKRIAALEDAIAKAEGRS